MAEGAATPSRVERSPAVLALISGLVVVAVTASWFAAEVEDAVEMRWAPFVGLLLVSVASGWFHLEFRQRHDVVSLTPFDAAVAPAIFLFAGPWAVILVGLGKALAEVLLRVAPVKATFNVAQWAAATGVGSLIFLLVAPGDERGGAHVAALLLAMLAISVFNHSAVLTVLILTEPAPAGEVAGSLRRWLTPGWLTGLAATITFGILFALAAASTPVVIPLFVVPLLFLHWASRGYNASQADYEHLLGLQRATHAVAATADPADVIPEFLEEVRRTFDAEVTDLCLDDGGVPVLYRATSRAPGGRVPHTGQKLGMAAAMAAAGGAVRLQADTAGAETAAAMRKEGWHELLSVQVGTGDHPGVLCVYNPEKPAGSNEADLAILSALASEVAGAIERDRLVHAMLRSEGRFRALAQYSSDLTVVIDVHGVIQSSVPTRHPFRFPDNLGEVGSPIRDLLHPDDLDIARAAFQRLMSRAFAVETIECRLRAADGTWRDVEVIATNLLDDPSVEGIALTCRDVTQRTRTASLLSGQSEVLQAIARGVPVPEVFAALVAMLEAQSPGSRGSLLLARPEGPLRATVGAQFPDEVTDRLAERLLAPPDQASGSAPRRTAELTDVTLEPEEPGTGRPMTGTLCAARIEGTGERSGGVVALLLDEGRKPQWHEWRLLDLVSRLAQLADERVRAQELLVQQATEDPLTGLPNRVVFLDRTAVALSRLERSGRGVAVVFVDLDRFKVVNDSLGHESGDQLLQILAGRLRAAMRTNDTVARFGGDEFTILCDDVDDESEVTMIADRIKEIVAVPVTLRGHELAVTASVGIAHTNDPHTDPGSLIDNADMAMYRAKMRGGDHLEVFDPVFRTRALRDLVTQSALRTSIEHGDLRVHYQPVISLESGAVVGVEALVRWQHPQLGLVAPDDFVPLAEQTGLIVPIGRFVLREACLQSRRWQATCPQPLMTSVNLSGRQFTDPTLVQTVAEIIASTGVAPSSINLEITETVLMDNVESTSTTLQQLLDLGVRLTIDDFGTGYSSLSYLKRFPVVGLKIDRSFVSGLVEDADDSAIVTAVVGLAHSLGMIAVAEGVETTEQRDRLIDLGCDAAQGYLYSRPVTAEYIHLDQSFG